MNNKELLKKALESTLESLSVKKEQSSKGNIISGWNEEYSYGGFNIFETTFVDTLIFYLKAQGKDMKIGWEVNYPYVESKSPIGWYRSKLDLAMGWIDHSLKYNNWEPQALFQTPVEVKKLAVNEIGEYSLDSEMYIWQDIFKLYGYHSLEGLPPEVGAEKIMLTFSSVPAGKTKDFEEAMKGKFLKLKSIHYPSDNPNFMNGWFSSAKIDEIKKELEKSKKIYNLDYFLEKILSWEKEEHRKFLTETCGLSLENERIVKGIDFVKIPKSKTEESSTNLVASLLYLN